MSESMYQLLPLFIALGLIILSIARIIPNLRLNNFQYQMLMLKDELFKDAAKGLIYFDHPAYVLLHTTMTNLIRYSSRVSLFHIIASRKFKSPLADHFEQDWSVTLKTLPTETQQKLSQYRIRMEKLISTKLFFNYKTPTRSWMLNPSLYVD